jgi:hypothetical protein
VDLPSGFPEERAAIPDGARIVAAATTSVSGQTVSTVEYLTEDEIESLAEDLKGDLEGEGWTQLSATEADGEIFATYSGEDSTESLTLTITNSQYDGYTQVDLAISTAE